MKSMTNRALALTLMVGVGSSIVATPGSEQAVTKPYWMTTKLTDAYNGMTKENMKLAFEAGKESVSSHPYIYGTLGVATVAALGYGLYKWMQPVTQKTYAPEVGTEGPAATYTQLFPYAHANLTPEQANKLMMKEEAAAVKMAELKKSAATPVVTTPVVKAPIKNNTQPKVVINFDYEVHTGANTCAFFIAKFVKAGLPNATATQTAAINKFESDFNGANRSVESMQAGVDALAKELNVTINSAIAAA